MCQDGYIFAPSYMLIQNPVDKLYKSHNAPILYPQCTILEQKCVHISLTKWCIVAYLSNALWDLWDWSIPLNNWSNFDQMHIHLSKISVNERKIHIKYHLQYILFPVMIHDIY